MLIHCMRVSAVEEMSYCPVVIHRWLEITAACGITKQVPVHIVEGVGYLQLSRWKRNLVWILAQRGDVQETKKRAEWKIRKDSKRGRVSKITVENFLLGARLMGFTDQSWGMAQGGQETDVSCAVRSTTRGTLFGVKSDSKKRTCYLFFRGAVTFLLFI